MVDPSRPVNPKMHYVVLTVASSECLKQFLNPLDLFTIMETDTNAERSYGQITYLYL